MPNSYPRVYKLKCSCGSVYNGETKKKVITRSIEHQQESIKGNWTSSGATEHTKECHGCFDWLHPKTLSIKNRYYDRKVRESLEIDMAVVKYGQEKVLNRDNGNFVKTNAWKPLFRKMKTLHWNLTSFSIRWRFTLYFHQFENGFNQCGRNITLLIIYNFCSTFSRLWCFIFDSLT